MDQIDQIRQKIDIVDLIGSYITLKKAGRNFKALCPFHSEKTPSFIVSPERQIFKCFGCGIGGDVFKFLMEYEKLSFAEALRFLADKAGIRLKSFKPSAQQLEKDKLLVLNHLASEFYHYILLKHQAGKKGLNYLRQRGIRKSSMETFKLGYAPLGWQTLIDYLVGKKKYQPEDLAKAGLIIKSRKQSAINYYDRFRQRIIFPLTDHHNNILGFSGRVLTADLKGAKYINTPETAIYHKRELFYGLSQTKNYIKTQNQAVIVEGELDLISSWQAGVKNVVATKGTALTPDQINLIRRFCQRIVLSLDSDTAGDAAIRRGITTADKAGLTIRVALLKYGKDPDECARHSPLLWRQSIKKAIPVFDFYLKSAAKRFDKKSAEGKKYISEELLPLLAQITNEVVKAHYLKKLAAVLEVDEEAIIKEIERLAKKEKLSLGLKIKPKLVKAKKVKPRKERLEEFILSLLLQGGKETSSLIKKIDKKHFSSPAISRILTLLNKFLTKKRKFIISLFVKTLPAELMETFDNLYLKDLGLTLKEKKVFLNEFDKSRQELAKLYLKNQLSLLTDKIREKEKQGLDKKVKDLEKKFLLASRKLKSLN